MPQRARVYVDYAATAPLRPEVAEAMRRVEAEAWGNPSSPHAVGRRARSAVERARADVAGLLGCAAAGVIFTSGATEANNLAVFGAAGAAPEGRRHVVVSAVEHHSVLEPCLALGRRGWAVDVVAPEPDGRVAAERMAAALRPETALCALMLANNEVGALQPVAAVAAACRAAGVPLLCDAVAAAGRVPLREAAAHADLVTVSAHKIGGPQGAGALCVAPGCALAPVWRGGRQERGWRPGTENVAAIAGFGAAARLLREEEAALLARLRALDARLRRGAAATAPQGHAAGPPDPALRVPGLLTLAFPDLDGEALLVGLDLRGVAAGSGAACTSGSLRPSHVLQAMGLPPQACRFPVRLSLGWGSAEADVDAAAAALGEVVALQLAARGRAAGGAGAPAGWRAGARLSGPGSRASSRSDSRSARSPAAIRSAASVTEIQVRS